MNSNAQIVKSSKISMKIRVSGVKIGDEVKNVSFIARKNSVRCTAKGLAPFKIRPLRSGDGFVIRQYGTKTFETAKTPAKAFAAGVALFWS